MKYIILIGDGMGDFPLPELGGKTPLEAAATPAMDYLASRGELLTVRTIPEGMTPGSDVANLSLMGYRPEDCYSGRAPLEAGSLGVTLAIDEIAFRCNLVTLDFETDGRIMMRDYSAGHISTGEATEIIRSFQTRFSSNTIQFHPGVSYRHLMVYKGDLPGLVTVPPHDHSDQDVSGYYARYLAHDHLKDLFTRAQTLLADHPVNKARKAGGRNMANGIWLWGEGRTPAMETLAQRFGVTGALISAVDLVKGIGVYAGLDIIAVPGATGYLDTNYQGKSRAALAALAKDNFVFVHVEAPDEAGHQGLIKEKIQAIEDFDRKIVQPILDGLTDGGEEFRLLVGMDHLTPIALRTHVDLPVPFVLYDSREKGKRDGYTYSEENAKNHGVFLPSGETMFRRLLELP